MLLLEQYGAGWWKKPFKRDLIYFGLYYFIVVVGVVLVLRISLLSNFTLIFIVPLVFLALWQLVKLNYVLWKSFFAPWLLILFLLSGTFIGLQLMPLELEQTLLIEYVTGEKPWIPSSKSINPDANRVINV